MKNSTVVVLGLAGLAAVGLLAMSRPTTTRALPYTYVYRGATITLTREAIEDRRPAQTTKVNFMVEFRDEGLFEYLISNGYTLKEARALAYETMTGTRDTADEADVAAREKVDRKMNG